MIQIHTMNVMHFFKNKTSLRESLHRYVIINVL